MADFTEKTDRPAQAPDPLHAITATAPVGPPTPTMDLDTGLPWAVEGETIAAESAEQKGGN